MGDMTDNWINEIVRSKESDLVYRQHLQDQQRLMQAERQAARYGNGTVTAAVTGWEDNGGRPVDGKPQPESEVASAVKRLVAQDRHRSLVTALEAVANQWRSDGRPHRFLAE